MEDFIKQYRLAMQGDRNAISRLLSLMEVEHFLKSDPLLRMKLIIGYSRQGDETINSELFSLNEHKQMDASLYFNPDIIKINNSCGKVVLDTKTWRKNLLEKECAEINLLIENRDREYREKEEKSWIEKLHNERIIALTKKEAEERVKRETEEKARKEAEKREQEENERKEAEEKARKEAEIAAEEEERELINNLRDTKEQIISSIILDMVYVEGGSFLMGNKKDPKNPPRIVEVKPFWIKRNDISEDEIWEIAKQGSSFHHLFLSRLSKVLGLQFQLPSHEQLEYAVKAKMCKMSKEFYSLIEDGTQSFDHKLYKHSNDGQYRIYDTRFKIVCSSPEFRYLFEEYKKKEDEEKKEKEKKFEALWHSVVDEYLNNINCYNYEEKGFFTKKTVQIRFLSEPLTWRIWNAFMNRDSYEEWALKDLQKNNKDSNISNTYSDIHKYNLDVFLNKLNEYKIGELEFDFIFNNKKIEEKLLKESIIDKGVYLYIKEK